MIRNSLIVSAFLAAMASAALVFGSANAEPAGTGHEAAIKACSTVNPTQPVTVVNAVDDGSGIGFSLVWLNDKDGNLWMCDADADGNVYVYSMLTGDLLQGAGGELIGLQLTADGGFEGEPQQIAEKVCVAHLNNGGEGGKVLVAGPDGLEIDPGFIIFVQNAEGATYLCNATGDAMIWAFEQVGDPLTLEQQTS
jgi:hypothetical protein